MTTPETARFVMALTAAAAFLATLVITEWIDWRDRRRFREQPPARRGAFDEEDRPC